MAILDIDLGVGHCKKSWGRGGGFSLYILFRPTKFSFCYSVVSKAACLFQTNLDFPLWLCELICGGAYFSLIFFSLTTVIIYQSSLGIPGRVAGGEKQRKEKKNASATLSGLPVSFFMSVSSDFLCEAVSNCSTLKVCESTFWVFHSLFAAC